MMEGARVARHRFLFLLQQSFVVVYVVAIGRGISTRVSHYITFVSCSEYISMGITMERRCVHSIAIVAQVSDASKWGTINSYEPFGWRWSRHRGASCQLVVCQCSLDDDLVWISCGFVLCESIREIVSFSFGLARKRCLISASPSTLLEFPSMDNLSLLLLWLAHSTWFRTRPPNGFLVP